MRPPCFLLWLCIAVACSWARLAACSEPTAAFEASVAVRAPPQRNGAAVALTAPTGDVYRAYVDVDGHVSLPALPEGAYLLDVLAIGFVFPQFRVDVRPRFDDAIAVAPVTTRMPLTAPFVLEPIGEAKYYTPRKPFDLRGMLMSPYGLMAVAGVFMLLMGPSMKVDPEDMKQMREEMKDTPFSFLMGSSTPASGAASEQPALAAGNARRADASKAAPSKKKR